MPRAGERAPGRTAAEGRKGLSALAEFLVNELVVDGGVLAVLKPLHERRTLGLAGWPPSLLDTSLGASHRSSAGGSPRRAAKRDGPGRLLASPIPLPAGDDGLSARQLFRVRARRLRRQRAPLHRGRASRSAWPRSAGRRCRRRRSHEHESPGRERSARRR
jgi:hypothetical protein